MSKFTKYNTPKLLAYVSFHWLSLTYQAYSPFVLHGDDNTTARLSFC